VGKQTMKFERDRALLEFVAQDRTR